MVISNPLEVKNEARIIVQLFEAGLKYFHLRKPNYNVKQLITLLQQIDKEYHHFIALHQHHEIASDLNVKRLHYTEKNRINNTSLEVQALQKDGYILSTSVHDQTVLSSILGFDYAFFGPVFKSISKPRYESKLPAGFYIDKDKIKTKVIALGGIEFSNLKKIREMNFDGAAVLGNIWNDPHHAVANFKKLKIKLS